MGSILSRCQKGRDGRTPFERLRGVPFAGETNILRTAEWNEFQIQVWSGWE